MRALHVYIFLIKRVFWAVKPCGLTEYWEKSMNGLVPGFMCCVTGKMSPFTTSSNVNECCMLFLNSFLYWLFQFKVAGFKTQNHAFTCFSYSTQNTFCYCGAGLLNMSFVSFCWCAVFTQHAVNSANICLLWKGIFSDIHAGRGKVRAPSPLLLQTIRANRGIQPPHRGPCPHAHVGIAEH